MKKRGGGIEDEKESKREGEKGKEEKSIKIYYCL